MKKVLEKEVSVENVQSNQDIISSLQKDYSLAMTWLSSLTDIEQRVLSAVYQMNKAVTIREIMRHFESASEKNMKTLKKDFHFKLAFIFPFSTIFNISENKLIEVAQDKKKDTFNTKELFENYPSFRKVDRTIRDLIHLKILISRELAEDKEDRENKKIKGLFFLNPIIRHSLDKIKDKHIQEEKDRVKRIDEINKELIKSGSKVQMNY
jgi:hypothetical protein